MSDSQHSLRKLQPDFAISPGTQVVVKVAKALPGGEAYKPAGSIGVVIEAPPSNREPYVVRFADGGVAKAYFDELALRRREVDDVLGHVDDDLRGCHKLPLTDVVGLDAPRETIEPTLDMVGTEVE